jgi:hypothetical protein
MKQDVSPRFVSRTHQKVPLDHEVSCNYCQAHRTVIARWQMDAQQLNVTPLHLRETPYLQTTALACSSPKIRQQHPPSGRSPALALSSLNYCTLALVCVAVPTTLVELRILPQHSGPRRFCRLSTSTKYIKIKEMNWVEGSVMAADDVQSLSDRRMRRRLRRESI